jgi:hypothetical protein
MTAGSRTTPHLAAIARALAEADRVSDLDPLVGAITWVSAALDLGAAVPEAGNQRAGWRLFQALIDIASGAAHPMFKPRAAGGQPTHDWKVHVRLWPAVLLELRHRHGEPLEQAAQATARAVHAAGLKLPGQVDAPVWRQLMRWRKDFIGRVDNTEGQARFEKLVTVLIRLPQSLDEVALLKNVTTHPLTKVALPPSKTTRPPATPRRNRRSKPCAPTTH